MAEIIKLKLGNVRFGYEHLFEKSSAVDTAEPKYSVEVLVPKSNTEAVTQIKDVIADLEEQVKKSNKGKLPKDFTVRFYDGDDHEDARYADYYHFSAKTANEPGVFSTERDANGKLKPLAKGQVKGGDYGHASVSAFVYEKGGNGISFLLNGVQKTRDGEAWGRGSAEADFDEFDDANTAPGDDNDGL